MRICVVALGKIGFPLAVQFASEGHEVIGAEVNATTVELVNSGIEPFPGEAYLAEKLQDVVSARLLTATTDTAAASRGPGPCVVVVPLFVDEASHPDFGWMDAATQAIAHGLKPGVARHVRDHPPLGHNSYALRPHARAGLGTARGGGVAPRVLPRTGPDRACLRRPAQSTRSWPVESTRHRKSGGSRSTSRCWTATRGKTCEAERCVADGLGRGRGVGQAGRYRLSGCQHRPGQSAREVADKSGIDARGDRDLQTTSRTATSTNRISPSVGTASRCTPGCTYTTTRRRRSSRTHGRQTRACRSTQCSGLRKRTATLRGGARGCVGSCLPGWG